MASNANSSTFAPAIAEDVLRSSGQPLDPATRAYMEPRFGHDFSQVRVHAGAHAANAARSVHARAFTVGHHIVFRDATPNVNRGSERHLLGHELAHVVQQRGAQTGGTVQRLQRQEDTAPPVADTGTSDGGVTDTGTGGSGATPTATPGSAEITVETGNAGAGWVNNAVHQQVCVDGYGGSKRCFSFGKREGSDGFQFPQFSSTWLGWSSVVVGALLQGEVYEPSPVSGATVYSRHTPTPAQASTWLSYITGSRLGLQDAYSVARHNCRLYSQWEFSDAPSHW